MWFVATGTAAHVLSIASLTEPWQQVVCHRHSHFNDDESTAPERVTHCRTVAVESDPHVSGRFDHLLGVRLHGRTRAHQVAIPPRVVEPTY